MDDSIIPASVPVDYSERGIFRSGLKMSHLQLILAIEDHGQISAAATDGTMYGMSAIER